MPETTEAGMLNNALQIATRESGGPQKAAPTDVPGTRPSRVPFDAVFSETLKENSDKIDVEAPNDPATDQTDPQFVDADHVETGHTEGKRSFTPEDLAEVGEAVPEQPDTEKRRDKSLDSWDIGLAIDAAPQGIDPQEHPLNAENAQSLDADFEHLSLPSSSTSKLGLETIGLAAHPSSQGKTDFKPGLQLPPVLPTTSPRQPQTSETAVSRTWPLEQSFPSSDQVGGLAAHVSRGATGNSLPDPAVQLPTPHSAPGQAVSQQLSGNEKEGIATLNGPDTTAIGGASGKNLNAMMLAALATDLAETESQGTAELQFEGVFGGPGKPLSGNLARPEFLRHIASQTVEVFTQSPGSPVEISLKPEELGRVRIALTPSENTMTVLIATERPETEHLMRRHIDQLASEFRRMGYDDISFSFSDSSESEMRDSANKRERSNRPELDTDEMSRTPPQYISVKALDMRM